MGIFVVNLVLFRFTNFVSHSVKSDSLIGMLYSIDGETVETVSDFLFWGAPKSLQMVTAAMILKDTCSLEEKL